MKRFIGTLAALSFGVLVSPALADTIPYGNTGHVAAQTTVTSSGNGIDVYFYGSSAADTDTISVEDINTGWTSGAFANNHSSTQGEEWVIGSGAGQIDPGDTLVFFLNNTSTGSTFASTASYSSDGTNHAYMTAYTDTGGSAVAGIPAGMYVGFEDLPINGDGCGSSSDCDYNDDNFVFVGVDPITPAPEPGSIALLGTALLGAAAVLQRRLRLQ